MPAFVVAGDSVPFHGIPATVRRDDRRHTPQRVTPGGDAARRRACRTTSFRSRHHQRAGRIQFADGFIALVRKRIDPAALRGRSRSCRVQDAPLVVPNDGPPLQRDVVALRESAHSGEPRPAAPAASHFVEPGGQRFEADKNSITDDFVMLLLRGFTSILDQRFRKQVRRTVPVLRDDTDDSV